MNLDFYFDYSSPFAYLASTQVEALAQRTGAELRWRPFLLGALFKTIGTPMVPFAEMAPPKQRYQQLDMNRWAAHWDVPFGFPTRFPMNTVKALRMTLQLAPPFRDDNQVAKLVVPLGQAYWGEDRDINDDETLVAIANDAGLDGAALLAGCQNPEVKNALREETDTAVKAGLCGAPSFIVRRDDDDDGMLFWGQDRIPMVEKALGGWRPACG